MVVIIKPWGIQSIKGRRSLRRGVSAEEVQLIATKLRAFPPQHPQCAAMLGDEVLHGGMERGAAALPPVLKWGSSGGFVGDCLSPPPGL